jgi:D-ornithine 4,5-aminomutase subunit beta
MRAQMNTKYIESSTREATVTHVLNMFISKLTSADIQSTITPDEGRNVPWHIYNIEACDTAKQTLVGLDGLMEMVQLKEEGYLEDKARELTERAVLFLEEMVAQGGYFAAVENGMFVDSGLFPERNGDGIARKADGGVGAGTVIKRESDYFAPVTAHFGDNVYLRMGQVEDFRQPHAKKIKPEMEWLADGTVLLTFCFPAEKKIAEAAAIECAKRMGLTEIAVISREVLHRAEGTRIELKGKVGFEIDVDSLVIPKEPDVMSDEDLRAAIAKRPMRIVCGTIGEDEHSVGLREIIDIKHGGIEKYGIEVHYLGTSVPPEKLVGAAIELNADAMLASVIISHDDIHYKNIARIDRIAREMGVRDKLTFLAGGTQVDNDGAVKAGADAGFGRGTHGNHVATFLVKERERK